MCLVTEILRLRQTGQSHAGAGSGRFVHLAVNQNRFGVPAFQIDNAGVNHFMIKIVAFTGTFANAGKNGITAVPFGNIVNQFHNQNRFADAGTSEQTDFAAFGIRFKQINNLNACSQDFGLGRLIDKRRRRTMNRIIMLGLDVAATVHRLADNINDTPEKIRSDRHLNRRARINHILTAHQTVGAVHGNTADNVFAQMLRNLQHQILSVVFAAQSGQNRRQIFGLFEPDVNNRPHNLADMPQSSDDALFFDVRADFGGIFLLRTFNLPDSFFLSFHGLRMDFVFLVTNLPDSPARRLCRRCLFCRLFFCRSHLILLLH